MQKNVFKGSWALDWKHSVPWAPGFQHFVSSLLDTDPKTRLGYNGVDEVKGHTWFTSSVRNGRFSWEDIEGRDAIVSA